MKTFMMIFVNLLTTLRIIGMFLLLPIYINYGGMYAAMLSILCYFTDLLDGVLARKCHVSTFFGALYDSMADKIFTIANFIVLFTITKMSLFPILCEAIILVIGTIKFLRNENVQSSKMGKLKVWFTSLTVILVYLISDINKLTFLPQSFINFIIDTPHKLLYSIIFIPLCVVEVLTILSYLTYLKDHKKNEVKKLPKIDLKLSKSKKFKDQCNNFKLLWLNNDFYEKYKDSNSLKDIRKYVKEHR